MFVEVTADNDDFNKETLDEKETIVLMDQDQHLCYLAIYKKIGIRETLSYYKQSISLTKHIWC
jgi:hypothetical protein